MSGTDDAAIQIVFRADPMANRDKIIAALRKAGHLRTPGTVEVRREYLELAALAFEIVGFDIEPEWLTGIRAAIAAGADDGE